MTVNDATTSICLLCYKQITSISKFRERCSRANELLKKQRKHGVKTEGVLEQKDSNSIPSIDLKEDDNALPTNALWTGDAPFGEISGWFFNWKFKGFVTTKRL